METEFYLNRKTKISEDLSKLKKNRTAVRSMMTKLIYKIKGTINSESETVEEFEVFLEQLSEMENNLNSLNKEIEDLLTIDTISEDMESSEEIKENTIFCKIKLSSKIKKMNSNIIQIDADSKNIQLIDSDNSKYVNINLPKLHVNKYSGNYSGRLDFYIY
ncbi:hypothetical protein NPIL_420121 [Nephila pilipes]|uniref:Uncharacterized protein n=1 Tax=Nephila pilipes TaxID=299642 RepID=A0A8X6ISH7_NEPPI|nr:hypothetical protein NPIL_420121 [Nephila pilipes]